MSIFKNIKANMSSILSVLLVAAAAVLGADCSFAMAVAPVEPAETPNPGGEGVNGTLPGGGENRPANEKPVETLAPGVNTHMPNKAATATDVRDFGLEAEDYDKDVVLFNKFKYTSETVLATRVKPVKATSYVVEHFRVGQPNLDAVYTGSPVAAIKSAYVTINGATTISLNASDFDNPDALTEYSTVIVKGVPGFSIVGGVEVEAGALQLYVLNHNDNTNKIVFQVVNGPAAGGSNNTAIPTNAKFLVCASAGSESQMRVAPVSFLPEKSPAILQKMIKTCVITDAFKEQSKKSPLGMNDVIKYTTDIFKRECARTHWLGQEGRADVKVPELNGNREAAYMSKGIFAQIPAIYTHGEELTDDDLMAISSMMFTEFAQSDNATAFVGKNEMKRIMKLVNSSNKYKDVGKVEVNEYGIKVRKYADNFGTIEFIYDQTLDELGYSDYMAILDLSSMVRYYMRDDKVQTQDMKKTGEAREAEVWSISRIDCYCLKGGNALIVRPAALAADTTVFSGVTSYFEKGDTSWANAAAIPSSSRGKKFYLTQDLGDDFKAGTIIEWNSDFQAWEPFDGRFFV